jgi:integrase
VSGQQEPPATKVSAGPERGRKITLGSLATAERVPEDAFGPHSQPTNLRMCDGNWSHSAQGYSQTKEGLQFKDVKQKIRRRVVTLPAFVLEGLKEAMQEQTHNRQTFGRDYQDNDLICCLPDGSPIPPNTLKSAFRRHQCALGCKTRFHDLRHGHASQALQNGVPVKTVQARLWLSTAAFTLDVYGHLLPGPDERAAEATQLTLGAAIERQQSKSVH